jgi:RNA recognition motif-containing protein
MSTVFQNVDATWVAAVYALLGFLAGLLAGRYWPARTVRVEGRRPREARRSQQPAGEGGRQELYVGNLPYDVEEPELQKMFSEAGKVASVRIITNRFNGRSKGYGFVEMADESSGRAAMRSLNGREVRGRKLVVNEAKSQAGGD